MNLQLPKCDHIEEVKVQPDGQVLIQWSAQRAPDKPVVYGLLLPEREGHRLMQKLTAAWLASGRPAPK